MEKNDRLINKRNIVSNDVIYVIIDVVNDNFYKDEDKVNIDLVFIIVVWLKKKYIMKSNDIKILKEKFNDFGRVFSGRFKVFRDEDIILIDDFIVFFNFF